MTFEIVFFMGNVCVLRKKQPQEGSSALFGTEFVNG